MRLAETAMGELNNGIEDLEVASSDVNPDIQAALVQPYLQAHFKSTGRDVYWLHFGLTGSVC